MLKKIFAFGAAIIVGTSLALASPSGKTPSSEAGTPITAEEACDAGVYAYAVDFAFTNWVVFGLVTDFTFGGDQESTDAFVTSWNAALIANSKDGVVPGLVIADANQYISFTAGSTFVPEEQGQWLFLYKDGCFVGEYFIAAELPQNPIPNSMTVSASGNSASFRPGRSFGMFRE